MCGPMCVSCCFLRSYNQMNHLLLFFFLCSLRKQHANFLRIMKLEIKTLAGCVEIDCVANKHRFVTNECSQKWYDISPSRLTIHFNLPVCICVFDAKLKLHECSYVKSQYPDFDGVKIRQQRNMHNLALGSSLWSAHPTIDTSLQTQHRIQLHRIKTNPKIKSYHRKWNSKAIEIYRIYNDIWYIAKGKRIEE